MKTVAIFGAGVGGLTVAHELSKFPEQFKINIYEKKNEIGGLARSMRTKNGCATEYCWRVFFGFYHNLLRIMSEIPTNDNHLVAINNLTTYEHLNIADNSLSFNDKIKLAQSLAYGITSCDERMFQLDNLSWWKAIETTNKSNLFREIGPWLGMDRYKGSYNSVIKVGMEMQIIPGYINPSYKDYVTTKPTSEALFDPWETLLRKRNVKFNMGTQLVSIDIRNKNAVSAHVYNDKTGNLTKIIADYYVFAIPVEALSNIINVTPELHYGSLNGVNALAKNCLHIQLSFQIYFNRSISIGKDKNAFLIVDSPWDLIILAYDQIYVDTEICKKDSRAKGAWSVAACTSYIPGIVYGKPLLKCSYDEIIVEIWAQLMNSNGLRKVIHDNNNFDLNSALIVDWSPLWPTYSFDGKNLSTTEPKFTNNAGSLALRPSIKTPINNVFIATAYAKETIDIFSMEAACISGIGVANLIYPERIAKPIRVSRPVLLAPFRGIDSISHRFGGPNMGLWFFVLLIILIIILVFYFLFKIILRKN